MERHQLAAATKPEPLRHPDQGGQFRPEVRVAQPPYLFRPGGATWPFGCFYRFLDRVDGIRQSPLMPLIAAGSGGLGGRVKGRGALASATPRRGALDGAAVPSDDRAAGARDGCGWVPARWGRANGPPGAREGAAWSGSGWFTAEWPGGAGQPALPWRAGPAGGPGHMVTDWMSPRLRGDAAAHSFEAARWLGPARQGTGGLTGAWREPAAVVPHRMTTAPSRVRPRRR